MNLYSPRTIRYLKDKYGFRTAKGLGQNFLTDPGVLRAMVEGSGIEEDDLVIEIGPGFGVLTREAADVAGRLVAVETDRRLEPILAETLGDLDNVEILWEDILKVDLNELIRRQRTEHDITGRVKIIGNLPYYITTPIIMKLLEEGVDADSITVMMQKEVADRLQAGPGGKDYGAITVAVRYYCEVEPVVDVPKEAFSPRPKVDSAVLNLRLRDEKATHVVDDKLFFHCVRAGFGQRRKTLLNALSAGLGISKDDIRAILQAAGIEENRRAETLSIEEFAGIANRLAEDDSWKRMNA